MCWLSSSVEEVQSTSKVNGSSMPHYHQSGSAHLCHSPLPKPMTAPPAIKSEYYHNYSHLFILQFLWSMRARSYATLAASKYLYAKFVLLAWFSEKPFNCLLLALRPSHRGHISPCWQHVPYAPACTSEPWKHGGQVNLGVTPSPVLSTPCSLAWTRAGGEPRQTHWFSSRFRVRGTRWPQCAQEHPCQAHCKSRCRCTQTTAKEWRGRGEPTHLMHQYFPRDKSRVALDCT